MPIPWISNQGDKFYRGKKAASVAYTMVGMMSASALLVLAFTLLSKYQKIWQPILYSELFWIFPLATAVGLSYFLQCSYPGRLAVAYLMAALFVILHLHIIIPRWRVDSVLMGSFVVFALIHAVLKMITMATVCYKLRSGNSMVFLCSMVGLLYSVHMDTIALVSGHEGYFRWSFWGISIIHSIFFTSLGFLVGIFVFLWGHFAGFLVGFATDVCLVGLQVFVRIDWEKAGPTLVSALFSFIALASALSVFYVFVIVPGRHGREAEISKDTSLQYKEATPPSVVVIPRIAQPQVVVVS
jgi:hypothetical protein